MLILISLYVWYFHLGNGYVRVNWKKCDTYGGLMYDKFIDAERVCSNDENCLGVYDYYDDDNYRLCPTSKSLKYSPESSVYRKTEYSGDCKSYSISICGVNKVILVIP